MFAYLGVEVKVDKNTNEMTFLQQTGFIDKMLKSIGIEDCNAKLIPVCITPLGTDADGPRCQLSWDYASVIEMLRYVTSNSQPDIQFAVHQCARFTHNPQGQVMSKWFYKSVITLREHGTRDSSSGPMKHWH